MVVCASATLERFVAHDGAYARVARTLDPHTISAQRSALTSNFFRQLSLRINLDRFQPKRDYRTLYYRCRHDMEERVWEDVWCRWFYCDYIGLGQGTCCRSESRRQMWGELLAGGRFHPATLNLWLLAWRYRSSTHSIYISFQRVRYSTEAT